MNQPLRPPVRPVDLSSPKSIHVVAIGGAGMAAIAQVLIAMGHELAGSDLRDSNNLRFLDGLGATTWIGHDAAQLAAGVDLVTRSSAVGDDNVEIVAARERDIEVHSRADMMHSITVLRRTLAISGTHGKTTTSSMLTVLLRHAGADPSFIVGAPIAGIGTGAHWGSGELMVVEADESDGSAFVVDADGCVVTSLDPDHLDRYGTIDRFIAAFDAFLDGVDGPKVVCSDEPAGRSLAERHGAVTYGLVDPGDGYVPDFAIVEFTPKPMGSRFFIERAGGGDSEVSRVEVSLSVPGIHNAKNATGAFALATMSGIDPETAAAGLGQYRGVARRYELRGERDGVTFVDDYAHLPAEVSATVTAAAQGGWGRVVAVFQPHRYTRTKSLGATFGDAFVGADQVVITDIYAANEVPIEGVSARIVYDAVVAADPERDALYVPFERLADWLADNLRSGDLCLTMGAGDLTAVPDQVLAAMARDGGASNP